LRAESTTHIEGYKKQKDLNKGWFVFGTSCLIIMYVAQDHPKPEK
jgi:hypothetical protein